MSLPLVRAGTEVELTFPDGTVLTSSAAVVHARLPELAGREVRLTALPPVDDTSRARHCGRSRRVVVSGQIGA
ncbi:hypothetical protein [Mycolicibacterium elephantis]|uniref:Uncharacterized protein n=1 Tax=Mycolicibacterium elephantis DSM 44368 TaxID=1335622 RepID=A0A439DMM9_9MYCO|nr:hypothetical protein [Mycolicibacterium elephantis]RWA16281.1 hypothetical protein MELE44368_06635 [Mycolicibacterium elephantis DSM 44368]